MMSDFFARLCQQSMLRNGIRFDLTGKCAIHSKAVNEYKYVLKTIEIRKTEENIKSRISISLYHNMTVIECKRKSCESLSKFQSMPYFLDCLKS